MVLMQQSFYLLDAGAVCAIFLLNSHRFFFISIRTQLNAVHVHVHVHA